MGLILLNCKFLVFNHSLTKWAHRSLFVSLGRSLVVLVGCGIDLMRARFFPYPTEARRYAGSSL